MCSNGVTGIRDQESTSGVSRAASDLGGRGVVELSDEMGGLGSSIVLSKRRRSGSKTLWLPMLRVVLPAKRSSAPGPTMKRVLESKKSRGYPT